MRIHVVDRALRLLSLALPVLALACGGDPDAGQLEQSTGPRLAAPAVVEFPDTLRGAVSVAEADFGNEGDEPLELVIQLPKGRDFSPERRALVIPPGESRTVRFFFDATRSRNGKVEEVARLQSEAFDRAMILRANTIRTCDPCSVYIEDLGCVRAQDGMACGTATECSDGGFCEAGSCVDAAPRDGAWCQTACGSEGRCQAEEATCQVEGSPTAPLWTEDLEAFSDVLVADGDGAVLQVRTEGGWSLLRLDRDGREHWAHAQTGSCRALDADLLVCTKGHGWAAIDPKSGATLWETELPFDEPRMVGDRVFGVWPRAQDGRNPIYGALELAALDRTSGKEVWRVQVGKRMRSVLADEVVSHLEVLLAGEELRIVGTRVQSHNEAASSVGVFALDGATGRERWAQRVMGALGQAAADEAGRTFAALHLGHTTVGEGGERATRAGLVALSSAGEILWHEEKLLPGYVHQLQLDEPTLAVGDTLFLRSGEVRSAPTGEVLYQQPVMPEVLLGNPAQLAAGLAGGDDLEVFAVGDGSLRWSLPLPPFYSYDLVATDGAFPLRLLLHGVNRAGEDRDTICSLDERGRVVSEFILPGRGEIRTAIDSDRWYRTVQREDGGWAVEAWPVAP